MSQTYLGATLSIATGLPATIDPAGFAALTYVAATVGTVSIGAIGDTHESIPVPDLTRRRTITLKGGATGDTTSISLSRQRVSGGELTAAQLAFKAASDGIGQEYSIRIQEAGADAAVHYIGGPVMNWKMAEMTTTSYAGFSFDVSNNTGLISVHDPA